MFIFISDPVPNYTCVSYFTSSFFISLQENPSKTEMSVKMETALQFPTAADLKDLQEVEGKFSGESCFYGFASILYAVPLQCPCFIKFSCFCSYFTALQPEQELDLAQLVEADIQEATEYGKKHTLKLLRKIRKQLTEVGLQAAALLEDMAQKYILAVNV